VGAQVAGHRVILLAGEENRTLTCEVPATPASPGTVLRVRVDVPSLMRAHASIRTEAPPEPWTPAGDHEALDRLIEEMIAAGLARGNARTDLTLSFSNIVVEMEDDDDDDDDMPRGTLVAVSIRGAVDWLPERTWRPGTGAVPPFVNAAFEAAANRAGAVFGYTRATRDGGTVVVWFGRAD
jgi:hypothetical protein